MSNFVCPVCGKELNKENKSLSCENGHNFDFSKRGYVNLLLSQQAKAKNHGDDRLMVLARRDFLGKGYYNPLLIALCETIQIYARNGCRILDAGCGECFYTANIYEYLVKNRVRPEMLAVDISKAALSAGSKRSREIELAVASVFRLPVKEESCDVLLSVFSPFCGEEFQKILKNGGILIRVIPLERHLWSLKKAVYDTPYENEAEVSGISGFTLLTKREIRETIHLPCGEDICNVFAMTPYYYKTSAEDRKKLQDLSALDTETEFGILTYRKNGGK